MADANEAETLRAKLGEATQTADLYLRLLNKTKEELSRTQIQLTGAEMQIEALQQAIAEAAQQPATPTGNRKARRAAAAQK